MTAMLEKTIDDTIVDQPFADDANVDEPPTSAPTLSKVVDGKTVTMTPEQADAFGREIDAIRERVVADLGARDATYIRRVIKAQRGLEVGGRALLFAGIFPPAWLAGTAMLAASKILDNMEIGHNVMHGQYDWMGDPALTGRNFEWDSACPSDQWRHSHNYMHHTHTNIVGMDRDVGYGILRMSEDQKWVPYYRGNPIYAFVLMVFFQYGVALHELETESESRGQWYFRQLLGSANLTGGKLFHLMSGNLSFQIEHHLFPDIPAHRHPEMAVEVREICERYGLPYNTGGLAKQFGSVVSKIVRFALPWSKDEAPSDPEPDAQDDGQW